MVPVELYVVAQYGHFEAEATIQLAVNRTGCCSTGQQRHSSNNDTGLYYFVVVAVVVVAGGGGGALAMNITLRLILLLSLVRVPKINYALG